MIFEGKNKAFYLKKFKGSHFKKNLKQCLKWENEHGIFFFITGSLFYRKAHKKV